MKNSMAIARPDADQVCNTCQFNFRPAEYIDRSWFETLGLGPLMARMQRSERARPWLSRQLIRQFGLAGATLWNEADDPLRIGLLPSTGLRELVLKLGIVPCAHALPALVDGPSVRVLAQGLGQQVHAFGLREGRAIAVELCVAEASADSADAVVRQAPINGMTLLRSACADMPQAIYHRILLKLPRDWSEGLLFRRSSLDARRARRMTQLILRSGDDHDRNVGEGNAQADA